MQDRPYSLGERSVLITSRLLSTAAIAGLIGAVINFFYEKIFDPEAYAAGPALARGLFLFVWTIPFIIVALIFLGLPTSYLLRRLGWENWPTYSLVGAALGAGFLYALFPSLTPYGICMGAVYGSVCATIWLAMGRMFQ
jgi:energy-converting hydrogenase Eha subunit A